MTRQTCEDVRLRNEVIQRLERCPGFDVTAVGVTAREGVVTLTGFVDSVRDRLAVERLARLAPGVRAVANDIRVWLGSERWDADIARDAVQALDSSCCIPDSVQVVVENAQVTLTGTANWRFQRSAAEEAIRHVAGIRTVANRIRIVPLPSSEVLSHWVRRLSQRRAEEPGAAKRAA